MEVSGRFFNPLDASAPLHHCSAHDAPVPPLPDHHYQLAISLAGADLSPYK